MFSVLLAMSTIAVAAPPADVVVVCPTEFRPALEPWLAHRRAQGRTVDVIDTHPLPTTIKARLREAFDRQPRLTVVLVGDAEPDDAADSADPQRCVPAWHVTARVNVVFGSEPEIATDNGYVDFDDDGLPDAAIGRLPVDTPEELTRLVQRTIEYERSRDFGAWRRRIQFVAGVGGFGPVADTALENAAKTLLTRHLPPGFATTMTYAGPQSPYFPGAALFQSVAVRRFNEGCLMWVYIGHGSRRDVDRLVAADGVYPIFGSTDVSALAPYPHPPLACFLSCYSGAFDGRRDCLAEEMLRSPGGPVGVLCGSRVTMPYAMSILGQELMTALFHERRPTLGDVLLTAKRATLLRSREDVESRQFDALATMLMPMAADLAEQRAEHLHLFNLLGDPLLAWSHPQTVEVAAPGEAVPGESLSVRGTSPLAGRAVVELVVRRDRLTFAPEAPSALDVSQAAQAGRLETYRRANDPRLWETTCELPAGTWELTVPVPAEARGDCHVRVYVEGADAFALGSTDVRIRAPRRLAVTP